MTTGERRALTKCLVATANDEAAKNDELRVSCFTHAGSLMHWTKS